MDFSVCTARFLVGSGGFLTWFLWKRNTPTFMWEHSNRASNKVSFVCANLMVKTSRTLLVSKIANFV